MNYKYSINSVKSKTEASFLVMSKNYRKSLTKKMNSFVWYTSSSTFVVNV